MNSQEHITLLRDALEGALVPDVLQYHSAEWIAKARAAIAATATASPAHTISFMSAGAREMHFYDRQPSEVELDSVMSGEAKPEEIPGWCYGSIDCAPKLLSIVPPAQPVAEGFEELARPTDLSKRLRGLYERDTSRHTFRQAADEIERYYGGMLAWKQTAEAKDASLAQLAERVAVLEQEVQAAVLLTMTERDALADKVAVLEARQERDREQLVRAAEICDGASPATPQPHADEAAKGLS
jgi:hypothetical protein